MKVIVNFDNRLGIKEEAIIGQEDKLGLDPITVDGFAVDSFDDTHLSSSGAEKISRYLAKYLAENYELSDHRGEKDYLDWEEDYQKYLIMKEKMKSQ